MTSCACDYDHPEFYVRSLPRARKCHKCCECGMTIETGETYERVTGLWEGTPATMKTCVDCYSLREALQAMPCFCWEHENLFGNIKDQFDYSDFTPGARFYYLRLMANHRFRLDRLASRARPSQ